MMTWFKVERRGSLRCQGRAEAEAEAEESRVSLLEPTGQRKKASSNTASRYSSSRRSAAATRQGFLPSVQQQCSAVGTLAGWLGWV